MKDRALQQRIGNGARDERQELHGTSQSNSGSDWGAAPDSSEASRELMNHRVAYFGRVFFLLSFTFYVRNIGLMALFERAIPPFGHPALLLHVAAMSISALQWCLCRTGRRTERELQIIDTGGFFVAMSLYAALTVVEASGFEHAVAVKSGNAEVLLVALIMVAFTTTHAIIVPSSVRRMFWVSVGACVIATISAYAIVKWRSLPSTWMPILSCRSTRQCTWAFGAW